MPLGPWGVGPDTAATLGVKDALCARGENGAAAEEGEEEDDGILLLLLPLRVVAVVAALPFM